MLILENITGGYTKGHNILQGVNLHVKKGECVGILGLNGSGKSTLGKAIMNMLPYRSGRITLDGENVSTLPAYNLTRKGIGFLMQGAPVFDHLTIEENLRLASIDTQKSRCTVESPSELPSHQRADTLSGGQRHQLALHLALDKQTKLFILDEPSAGLAPSAVTELYKTLAQVREQTGVTILLIEQNVHLARDFCHSVHVMNQGWLQEFARESSINENLQISTCPRRPL